MKWLIYIFCIDAGLGLLIPGKTIYGNFSIFDLIIVTMIIFNYILKKKKINVNDLSFKISLIYILLAFWQLVSVLVSQENIVIGLGPILRTLYYAFIIMFLLPETNTKGKINGVAIAIVAGITINMFYSLYLWTLNERYWSGIIFLNNGLISRNTIYYYAILSLPFLFYLLSQARNKLVKILLIVLIAFNTVMVILTFSKGAWLLMVIIYFLYLPYIIKRINISKLILITVIIICSLLTAREFEVFEAFKYLQFNNYSVEEDDRLTYKLFALETGFNNPIFGVGDNYKEYTLKYAPHPPTQDPHDVALMLFAQYGLIALFLYLIIQFLYIKSLYENREKKWLSPDHRSISKLSTSLYIVAIILSGLTGVIFTSKLSIVLLFIIIGHTNVIAKENNLNDLR